MVKRRKNKRVDGISRIDSGATHGWFVRVYRRGKTHSKFHSDLKNGGKAKALKLAQACREELRARLGPPTIHQLRRSNRRNTSGVIGLSRVKKTSRIGTPLEYFVVSWRPEPGVPRNKTFSIRKLGEKEAFRQAVSFRRSWEREACAKVRKMVRQPRTSRKRD